MHRRLLLVVIGAVLVTGISAETVACQRQLHQTSGSSGPENSLQEPNAAWLCFSDDRDELGSTTDTTAYLKGIEATLNALSGGGEVDSVNACKELIQGFAEICRYVRVDGVETLAFSPSSRRLPVSGLVARVTQPRVLQSDPNTSKTSSKSRSSSRTSSATKSVTRTPSPTKTQSRSLSSTKSQSITPSNGSSLTRTPTVTRSVTSSPGSRTATKSVSASRRPSGSLTPTSSETPSATETPPPGTSLSPSRSLSVTASLSVSVSTSKTMSKSRSNSKHPAPGVSAHPSNAANNPSVPSSNGGGGSDTVGIAVGVVVTLLAVVGVVVLLLLLRKRRRQRAVTSHQSVPGESQADAAVVGPLEPAAAPDPTVIVTDHQDTGAAVLSSLPPDQDAASRLLEMYTRLLLPQASSDAVRHQLLVDGGFPSLMTSPTLSERMGALSPHPPLTKPPGIKENEDSGSSSDEEHDVGNEQGTEAITVAPDNSALQQQRQSVCSPVHVMSPMRNLASPARSVRSHVMSPPPLTSGTPVPAPASTVLSPAIWQIPATSAADDIIKAVLAQSPAASVVLVNVHRDSPARSLTEKSRKMVVRKGRHDDSGESGTTDTGSVKTWRRKPPPQTRDAFQSSPSPPHVSPALDDSAPLFVRQPPTRKSRKSARSRAKPATTMPSRTSHSPSRRSVSASASRLSKVSGLDVMKHLVEGYLEKRLPQRSPSERQSRSRSRDNSVVNVRSRSLSRSRSRSRSRERTTRKRRPHVNIVEAEVPEPLGEKLRRKLKSSSTTAVLEFEKLLSDEIEKRHLLDVEASSSHRKRKPRSRSSTVRQHGVLRTDSDTSTNPSDSLSGSLVSILRSRSKDRSHVSRPKSTVRFAPDSENSATTATDGSFADAPSTFERQEHEDDSWPRGDDAVVAGSESGENFADNDHMHSSSTRRSSPWTSSSSPATHKQRHRVYY